jgi:P27 family predicted phage terminase small subunit
VAPYLAGVAPADHPNKRKPGARRGPRLNLLTIIDRAALAAYCQAWGRWVEAEDNIQRFGAVIETSKGLPLVNPSGSVPVGKHVQRAVQRLVRDLETASSAASPATTIDPS